MDQAHQARVDFVKAIRGLTNSSKKLVLGAKADYDSAYGFWLSLADLQTGEEILANGKLLERAGEAAVWTEERTSLVDVLEKYEYDLSIMITACETVLSSYEEEYLAGLHDQQEAVRTAVDRYDPGRTMGYPKKEKKERYLNFLESYCRIMDTMATFNAYDEGLNFIGEVTAYHECFFRGYKNKGAIDYVKSSPSHTFTGFVGKRYYGRHGSPVHGRRRF